ncbi:GTPase ObgE [Alicyclobacillus sp. SO9]|uniref:GTPase ObgE n=1 Tax=Alicyclobacillus sp. SO9 TaxID=2665646 RepID=UPI0018E718BD|nr:GTPase ObgE [Alicyclobacillus sp. SO9]QQE81304.1 GTPase ObgE [Alicyclobacillus sp. SO9]
MFYDHARIYVKGGDGGNGMVAYRREKYVPLGGPAGGDGGHGGNVVFIVDEGLRTLVDFRYQRHFKAHAGENGRSKNQHGKGAKDLVVKVPPGTVVRDDDTGEFLGDLTRNQQILVVAEGGRGGRGNTHFASAKNKAPDLAEKGEPGVERWINLELKVLADVGLIGFPSVGKSTLLSVVSSARPKIGAYHFTTLQPELGVVEVDDGESFVLADIPGLIEGAGSGQGLGHEFLRHVERTRILLHVLDMSASEGRDPIQDYRIIRRELGEFSPKLLERAEIVVANKMDVPEAEQHLREFEAEFPELEVYPISGATRQGVQTLMRVTLKKLNEIPAEPDVVENNEVNPSEHKVYRFEAEKPFAITRDGNTFIVTGDDLEKLVLMTNFEQYDAVKRFQMILKNRGIDDALRKRGAAEGSVIRIADMEFDFVE